MEYILQLSTQYACYKGVSVSAVSGSKSILLPKRKF